VDFFASGPVQFQKLLEAASTNVIVMSTFAHDQSKGSGWQNS